MSAFFVGCRDILRGGRYDLVVKVHSRTPQRRTPNVARYFRRYQLENLLSSPGYVRNVLALFQREPGLGVVFPPVIHIGYATPGRGWVRYRERALELCTTLRIRVPLDGVSPLAPLGGMWVGRPEALSLLTDADWTYSQYGRPAPHRADLARVQERLVPLAAGERGFHCRTVLNAEHAAISHTALEYKLDQLSSTTPGYPVEQIQFLHRAGWAGAGGIVALTRMYMKLNHPGAMKMLHPVVHPAGILARRAVYALRALRGGGTGDER